MLAALAMLGLALPAHAQDAPPSEPAAEEADMDQGDSFAQALAQLQSKVMWTGYGDLTVVYRPDEVFQFDAAHFNPILGARLSDRLWAELELEFEHGGDEIKVEYGLLDYRFGKGATVRMGQFLVPIGQFNELLHPSFRWSQVSRPAMFRSVIPSVWSDVGFQVFGDVDAGTFATVGYNVYAINGLGVDAGTVFDPTADEPLRGLRTNRRDSNMDKALGAQLRTRIGRGALVGDTTLRLSGYTGAVNEDGSDRLVLANAALDSRLGLVKVLGEASLTLVDGQPLEQGAYGFVGVERGKLAAGARWDHVTTGLSTRPDPRNTVIASLKVAPHRSWNLRTEVAVPVGDDPVPTLAGMSAFYF